MTPDPLVAKLTGFSAFLALLGAFFAPLSILGWQAFTWLKFGYWPLLPVRVLVQAQVEWVGVQQLLDETPLSLFLFFVFLGLEVWLSSVEKRHRPKVP